MGRTRLPLFTVLLAIQPVFADSWARPVEKDYFSGNRAFVAHVTPPPKLPKSKLEVFRLEGGGRDLTWECELGNEGAPGYIFLSDDGQHVATVNENNSRVHGGMGDYVLAFYSSDGLIKNYSLEQILHYPDKIDRDEFYQLVQRSVSGRSWACMPMLLDRHADRLYFCAWLLHGKRWLAWDATTGLEAELTEDLVDRWDDKARQWAREAAKQRFGWLSALSFLGRLKNPLDRPIIESMLADNRFHTGNEHRSGKFVRCSSYSSKRSIADQTLATWDGKHTGAHLMRAGKYHYLGTVEGTIKLPAAPKDGDNRLCVYLLETDVPEDKWCEKQPNHSLSAFFWKYAFYEKQWPGDTIPFRIQGVMPGEYYVKAVWDKARPYTFHEESITGPPQAGDFQNTESPRIIATAGETTQAGLIDCAHKVGDATD